MMKVDVIIPTYKRPVYLKRAINSVLSQTYKNVSIIVVDDNNEEDVYRQETETLMLSFLHNNRVTYIKHRKNLNGAVARNTGIKYSKADYISFLDDDDIYLPNKILHQVEILKFLDGSWGGIACYHVRRYKRYAYKIYSIKENKTSNYCFDFLSGATSTPSSTLFIKKEVFEKLGGFDVSFKRHQDLEFLVRFYRHYKMAVSPYYDVYMQIEGFRNYLKSKQAFNMKNKFLETFKSDINLFNKKEQDLVYKAQWFEVACLFLKDRKFSEAQSLFKKYIFIKNKINLKDYLRVIFFIMFGFLPNLKKVVAIFLGIAKYREFSNKIFNKIG